jgi:hypothetical protein
MDRTTAILNLVAAIFILASSVLAPFVASLFQKKSNNVTRNVVALLLASKNTLVLPPERY